MGSFKAASVKEGYLAPGGAAFPADGVGAFGFGHKDTAVQEIVPYSEIKTKQNRQYPALFTHKYTFKSEQISAAFMKFLIACCKASDVTFKAITSGISKAANFTASGGVFTYENAKSLGVTFSLKLSPKERMIEVVVKRAFKPTDHTAILTASKTDTVPGALNVPMLDDENVIVGYIDPSGMFGSISIADERLADWSCEIKIRSTPNGFDRERVSGFEVNITGTLDGADPDEIAEFLSHEFCPDITIPINVDTPYNLIFKAGGCTKMGKFTNDDDKREAQLNITGFYDIEFVDTTGADIIFNAKL